VRQFVRRALAILAVASLIPACGGGSGGGGGETSVSGLIFTTKGGKGLVGDGGRGGYFDVLAKGGGDLSVRRSGGINVTVGAPKQTPYLGLNPMVVSSNFTLSLTSAVGTGQLNNADGTILNANGTVTGIWVKPGVTLTIRPNDGPTGNAPHTLVTLDLADGVLIEGTIKIGVRDGAGEGDGLGLDTSSASFVVSSPGRAGPAREPQCAQG